MMTKFVLKVFALSFISFIGLAHAESADKKIANCVNTENINQIFDLNILDNAVTITGKNILCFDSIPGDDQAEPRSEVPMYYLRCSHNDGSQFVTYIGVPATAMDLKVEKFKIIFGNNIVYSCGF